MSFKWCRYDWVRVNLSGWSAEREREDLVVPVFFLLFQTFWPLCQDHVLHHVQNNFFFFPPDTMDGHTYSHVPSVSLFNIETLRIFPCPAS